MKNLLALFMLFAFLPAGNVFAEDSGGKSKLSLNTFGILVTNYQSAPTLDAVNNFNVRLARLGVKGKFEDKVGYHLLGEFVSPKEKTPIFLQGWLEYYFPADITLRVGQFKYDFGQETLPSYAVWDFINASYASSGIGFKLGRSGSMFRDVGARLSAKYDFSKDIGAYGSIMVMNGDGINATDANENKDFVFHGHFILPFKIEVGGAWYMGSYADTSNIDLDESAGSFYIKMRREKYTFQAEYLMGNYDNTGKASTKPAGYYVSATYKIIPEVQLGIRYDSYEGDTNLADTDLNRVTFGAGYYFSKLNRIMLNYELRGGTLNDGQDDLITIQFYLAFK